MTTASASLGSHICDDDDGEDTHILATLNGYLMPPHYAALHSTLDSTTIIISLASCT